MCNVTDINSSAYHWDIIGVLIASCWCLHLIWLIECSLNILVLYKYIYIYIFAACVIVYTCNSLYPQPAPVSLW